MATKGTQDDGDRTRYFPAIVAKHGGPIEMWLQRLADLGDAKYPEQIDHLRETHGFTRTHANALVMYARGSTSSKRFRTPDDWFAATDPTAAGTAKKVFDIARKAHPELELVVAWNHPMLRVDGAYVIGISVAREHVLLNPFSGELMDAFSERLSAFEVNKKTFAVPLDWKVDAGLVRDLVDARLAEIGR
ncbi:MAG: DUF4287 domain-containing protein [Ilumatobacteraceae bacterium]